MKQVSVIDLTGDDLDASEPGGPSALITTDLDSLDGTSDSNIVIAGPGPSSLADIINISDDSDDDNPGSRDWSVEPRHRSVIVISDSD